MAADYTYGVGLVFDEVTMQRSISATGVLLDKPVANGGVVQQVYNKDAQPISGIPTNEYGYAATFRANIPMGWVSFGAMEQFVISYEAQAAGIDARDARIAAEAAAGSASAAATQAASAAAAAQIAADAAQSLADNGGGGGTGGLSPEALNTYLGGNAQDLITRSVGVQLRVNSTTWEPRPAGRIVIAIGEDPPPPDRTGFDLHFRFGAA